MAKFNVVAICNVHIVHNDSARSSKQWHISSKAKPFLIKSGHGTHVDGHFKDIPYGGKL